MYAYRTHQCFPAIQRTMPSCTIGRARRQHHSRQFQDLVVRCIQPRCVTHPRRSHSQQGPYLVVPCKEPHCVAHPIRSRAVLWDRDFFLLRIALKDRPKGPPTANRQPPPTAANCQPPTAANGQRRPTANHQPLPTATNHQSPTTNHRQPPPTATNRQLPTANHQSSPTANRQPPPTMVEHMSYTRPFWETWIQEHFFFSFVKDCPDKKYQQPSQQDLKHEQGSEAYRQNEKSLLIGAVGGHKYTHKPVVNHIAATQRVRIIDITCLSCLPQGAQGKGE